MNCAECQTEPLTPGHYCPCCGRKLSLQEQRTLGATSPAVRCQSCGGPSADGDLCKSCRQAFAPLLGSARVSEAKAAALDKTTEVALPQPVVTMDVPKVEAVKTESAKAVAALTAKAHLERAANPAPITRRPIVAAPPQRQIRTSVLITAAAALVVAMGAPEGARRLGFLSTPQTVREAQPIQATLPETRSAEKVVVENRASAVVPPPAAVSPKPRTVSPRSLAPSSDRLFERKDVDELPKIATRVEPRLPANLPRRPRNEIVVVRVLVSRTGRPSRVSLLRGSTLGRSSDKAVVAAVTRWTFSPAKKRGEAVNCWFNIAVRLGQAT